MIKQILKNSEFLESPKAHVDELGTVTVMVEGTKELRPRL